MVILYPCVYLYNKLSRVFNLTYTDMCDRQMDGQMMVKRSLCTSLCRQPKQKGPLAFQFQGISNRHLTIQLLPQLISAASS